MSRRHRNGGRDDSRPLAPEPLAVEVLDSHCHLDIMGADRDRTGTEAERTDAEDTDAEGNDAEGNDAGDTDAPGGGRAVAEILEQAAAVGVTTVVQVGVDLASSRWSAEVASEHPSVHAAVAIHPNEAGRGAATDDVLREIEHLAALPHVVAVGETGLDHFRTGEAGRPAQEASFRAHIQIARSTGKALMIHDRDAHDDVVRVLLSEGAPERVVFHCFSGGVELARICAEHGWYASFAGTVTFKNAPGLREAAAAMPADLLLVETDAPFLAPEPFRGRDNAPYLVPWTVRSLAQVTATDLDLLCGTLMANGRQAFSLP